MFATSTQCKYWMKTRQELERLRQNANQRAGERQIEAGKVPDQLLSAEEEQFLLRSYLVTLMEFRRSFKPSMRRSVIATAFVYVKRFYLNQSCMNYHPKNIALTCLYLACKVEEFNVSIDQFTKNVKGDFRRAQKLILSNELLVMQQLKFHLTLHLPCRAVEGFYIDIRARFPPGRDKINLMIPEVDSFVEKLMYTDACLLHPPSQIALASICYGAERCNLDLRVYLRDILFVDCPEELSNFQLILEDLNEMIEIDQQNIAEKEVIKNIEKRLRQL